jgi:GNAT superfamily N-acetyltransferase
MEFNYVTYEQLADIKRSHPLVAPFISEDKLLFYSGCPDTTPDFPVFFYLSESDRIVSRIGVVPDTMTDMKGYPHRWAWTGGLVTDPEYRGRGLATHLMQKMLTVFREKQILRGSVYSAQETLHIYKKIGGSVVGFAQRYLLLKTVRPVLRRYIGNGFIMKAIDYIYRFTYLSLVISRMKFRLNFSKYKVKKLDKEGFTKYHDLKVYHKDICVFNSNIKKISWKLSRTKHQHDVYFVLDESDKTIGYFILRIKNISYDKNKTYSDYSLMTLVDFGSYVDDIKKVFEVIFEKVVYIFFDSEANVLEIISSSEYIISCSKKNMFKRGGRGMSFTFNDGGVSGVNFSSLLDRWHLTSFCGDAFTFK